MATFLFDFDGTIYDGLSRLKDLFPDYDLHKQDTYTFSDIKYLNAYKSPTFYIDGYLNIKTVNFIKRLVSDGHSIKFYSSSYNINVHERKLELLKRYFGNLISIDFTFLDSKGFSDNTHLDFFSSLPTKLGSKYFTLVDDDPNRLKLFGELGYSYIPVIANYNLGYLNSCSVQKYRDVVLVPNHLLIK